VAQVWVYLVHHHFLVALNTVGVEVRILIAVLALNLHLHILHLHQHQQQLQFHYHHHIFLLTLLLLIIVAAQLSVSLVPHRFLVVLNTVCLLTITKVINILKVGVVALIIIVE